MQTYSNSLVQAALFNPASTQFPPAWLGHLPFAAWLVQQLRPQVFVELGTHSGNSYFACCQAVKHSNLQTKCYAVDTWEGDAHAGRYSEDVFDYVSQHNQARYSKFSTLLRTTFDAAVESFAPASIDLLHIDGLHSYTAVKHDFETWLPKLAPGAVVMLHDTNVREKGFGVWRFWQELQQKYPQHLEFFHCNGLGVVKITPPAEDAPTVGPHAWLSPGSEHQQTIIGFFASLGSGQLAHYDLAELRADFAELRAEIPPLRRAIDEYFHQLAAEKQHREQLENQIQERDAQLKEYTVELARHEQQLQHYQHERDLMAQTLSAMQASRSWRITAPVRRVGTAARTLRRVWAVVLRQIRDAGGLKATGAKVFHVLRRDGVAGVKRRLRHSLITGSVPPQPYWNEEGQPSPIKVVPYYLDTSATACAPSADICPTIDSSSGDSASIAIHLHLYYPDMLENFTSRLRGAPYPYDLYVSVPQGCDCAALKEQIRAELPRAHHPAQIVVETVPNCGRDIAPLLIQFSARLLKYDIIAHFHTKKSPHCVELSDWCNLILDLLLGKAETAPSTQAQIIHLLQTEAKLVYPEGQTQILKDRSGWAANYPLAADLLRRHSNIDIADYPVVEFSEGSMFWARTECVRDFLTLPLAWHDFPAEPIAADGTLAHALERLLLVFAHSAPGEFYRLHSGDSIPDYRAYEEQQDFSAHICTDVKVLSYYLPQFHPIAENDAWHGEGFTEWTNVRRANPLFAGHYQQHIPHADIGYYVLDTPATLHKQAQMMHKGGVHAQIFYHYWFSGKLILEQPARMLLDNPAIAMPFCFCWANENWTRRWDGNDEDVLLSQNYSAEDARAFIRYLLPFFHDQRYLRVEQRPVLFVYRPDSIPDPAIYLAVWEEECRAAGLEPPYVTAVLTRGATDPRTYGMDAGVERPLHDWTDGAVPDISAQLQAYTPMHGSVLDYAEVAAHYAAQQDAREYPWFRSLMPIWDNTARYGAKALMLHGSTPALFSRWLEASIRFTRATLPEDRRFVVVNAWNEWAEGAHLEPDTRYGYAYLNAVGRTLAGGEYGDTVNTRTSIPTTLHLYIDIVPEALAILQSDTRLRERFATCLSHTQILTHCSFSLCSTEVAQLLPPELRQQSIQPSASLDYTLQFRRIAVFSPTLVENMLLSALNAPGSVVVSNSYASFTPLYNPTENCSIEPTSTFEAPVLLFPMQNVSTYKNYRLCPNAHSVVITPDTRSSDPLPQVTTILRFHRAGDIALLQNALYCLAAMRDCIVTPLLALQNLTSAQSAELKAMLAQLPWAAGRQARILHFSSPAENADLRAQMLTEALQAVTTRYAAFLDYDDLLMPHAYSWLLERLQRSSKAVTFGRVYSTTFDPATGVLSQRRKEFVRGATYDDFLYCNHAPLHSFMLDLSKLDLTELTYIDGQQYLEDYYLTLQLFTRTNTDWDSLKKNIYIGDYLHSGTGVNTLASGSDEHHHAVVESPAYRTSLEHINQLRATLAFPPMK